MTLYKQYSRVGGMAALGLALAIRAEASAQQTAAAVSASSLVFDGVTVVDVEQGKLVSDQRVVIVGNHIQAVGALSAVKTPAGAQVVDAKGKYLIPGLWDLHVHPERGAPFLYPLSVANGVTGMRDAGSNVPLDTLLLWRREILAGTRVGPPRQLLAGMQLNALVEDVGRAVDSLVAAGANFLKLYPYTPEGAAAARRVGIPFGGHLSASPIEASDSGMRIVDHTSISQCYRQEASVEACRPIAERFKQNGTWWVPTLSRNISAQQKMNEEVLLGASGSGLGLESAAPVGERLAKVVKQFWSGSLPESGWLHGVVSVDASDSLRFLSVAQRVGMPILAGTDGGDVIRNEQPPGFVLHAELAILVVGGLTPLEALQSATLNPAKLLHGTDSLGTVAPGKLADLVLLDADPLADITNTTTIRAVVSNGRYFDRAALDGLLADVRVKAKEKP